MKPLNYNEVEWCCPQCRTPLKYIAYTAFSCGSCKRGWSINRHNTLEEIKVHKPILIHEDEYL